jgi:hypothetical protein
MRKRIIEDRPADVRIEESNWFDLEHLAQVEITSEAPGYPIESAFSSDLGPGWRALQPGEQTVRLLFDNPMKIKRIRLIFQEDDLERTQEFVLRRLSEGGQSFQEIVRQQYTFSPPGAAIEIEDYNVNLDNVTVLELKIKPDISGGGAFAKLAQLRIS